jgi:hypothetical protein
MVVEMSGETTDLYKKFTDWKGNVQEKKDFKKRERNRKYIERAKVATSTAITAGYSRKFAEAAQGLFSKDREFDKKLKETS